MHRQVAKPLQQMTLIHLTQDMPYGNDVQRDLVSLGQVWSHDGHARSI